MKDLMMREGEDIFPYKEKAPYTKSGYGEFSALRWDKEKDLIMCHECGHWFTSLATHVRSHDGMSSKDYKSKHGLPSKTALVSEKMRLAQIVVGSRPEMRRMLLRELKRFKRRQKQLNKGRIYPKHIGHPVNKHVYHVGQNKKGHCVAQILEKVRQLSIQLGRTPFIREIGEELGFNRMLIEFRFGSHKNLMIAAGLTPRRPEETKGLVNRKYSDEQLLHLMARFMRIHGRNVAHSDCRRGGLPCSHTYWRRFGSFKTARKLAKEYGKRNLNEHNKIRKTTHQDRGLGPNLYDAMASSTS